ncbi:MAG TPA: hypothetical protein VFI31_24160 [Pirellulales bacterium]|nr:hypothetical protein [Pirellulales bacterium]
MLAIQTGETWMVSLGGERRNVRVLAASGSLGWWRCEDLETGISFLAREPWFLERVVAVHGGLHAAALA